MRLRQKNGHYRSPFQKPGNEPYSGRDRDERMSTPERFRPELPLKTGFESYFQSWKESSRSKPERSFLPGKHGFKRGNQTEPAERISRHRHNRNAQIHKGAQIHKEYKTHRNVQHPQYPCLPPSIVNNQKMRLNRINTPPTEDKENRKSCRHKHHKPLPNNGLTGFYQPIHTLSPQTPADY